MIREKEAILNKCIEDDSDYDDFDNIIEQGGDHYQSNG
jgi:hypothetical protein